MLKSEQHTKAYELAKKQFENIINNKPYNVDILDDIVVEMCKLGKINKKSAREAIAIVILGMMDFVKENI